jgi:heat shock protein HslJ
MKKQIIMLIVIAVLIISCKSTGSSIPAFSSVADIEWKLIEVQIDDITLYERNDQENEAFDTIYTVKFDAEMVSGTGAPNKYSAPYTQGEGNTLKIMVIRSTMMASLFQPETLQEHVFYLFMQNVEQWSIENNKLILHSKDEKGSHIRLIFEQ